MNKEKSYDEIKLLAKIAEGSHVAFNSLFERYRNQLFIYFFKITKSTETSEEIVLEVFLKIWNGREAIPQIENFNQFLYLVAHNKALDFLRTIKTNPVAQQQVWNLIPEA